MADWPGAVAAMRDFYSQSFAAAPTEYQNEAPPQEPWPPSGPWIYFEAIQADSKLRGVGQPGNNVWLTVGNLFLHVYAPKGYGLGQHLALANAAGEIFRAKTLYNTDPGARLTFYAPSVRGGDRASDDGNWFGITVSIPFEFYFIG